MRDERSLEIYDNHSLARIAGRLFLIDTGSPKSFGLGGTLSIGDRSFSLSKQLGELSAASVSDQLGRRIDGLLGADVLSSFVVMFDWQERLITFADQPPAWPLGGEMELFGGLITTRFEIDGVEVGAFLDSGAKISYLDPDLLGRGPRLGRVCDFHPSCPSFETELEEREISWAGVRLEVRFGRLPESLQAMVDACGLRSVLGSDLFRRFAVAVDYPRRRLLARRLAI